MDDREPRPAIREYLVVLAVIVAISGAALWLFGGETKEILWTTSGGI